MSPNAIKLTLPFVICVCRYPALIYKKKTKQVKLKYVFFVEFMFKTFGFAADKNYE